jgi:phosphatidate cytidylyltransferase
MPAASNALLTRVLSAAILAPAAVAVAYVGGWLFAAFWCAAAVAVAWEWMTLIGPAGRAAVILAAAAPVAGALLAALAQPLIALAVAFIIAVLAAIAAPAESRRWAVCGALYAALLVIAPVVLRSDVTLGLAAILLLFAVVWTTDILGYFGGRAFGGPKLAPSISPAKTWSGAICGVVGTAVVTAAAVAAMPQLGGPAVVVIGVLLSIASQIGDLVESALKRKFGVKDASRLIPGHGGVMDRLDGFWAAALCAAIIGVARGGFADAAHGLLVW